MNRTALFGLVLGLVVAGCAPEKQPESPPAATTGDHGGEGPAIVPGGTTAEIWAQIRSQQLALETAVLEARTNEIHGPALAIRDLAVALRERAGADAGARRAELDASVDSVRTAADRLHEFGDAGNLSGAERELSRVNAGLRTLAEITSP
jgi:hypothetical protein